MEIVTRKSNAITREAIVVDGVIRFLLLEADFQERKLDIIKASGKLGNGTPVVSMGDFTISELQNAGLIADVTSMQMGE